MSLTKMMALHPAASGDDGDTPFTTAARHAMLCSAMCTSCADACLAEAMDMARCIRTCLDCADICAATSRLLIRQTERDVSLLRAALELCAHICEACAEECARHDHAHCRLCAEMCLECAQDCRAALSSIH